LTTHNYHCDGPILQHSMFLISHFKRRSCALHGRILSVKQDSTHLHYQVTWPKTTLRLTSTSSSRMLIEPSVHEDVDSARLIRRYFNLATNLSGLYERWSLADPNFKKKAPKFIGVRILKQDTWEALVGFICSSNNNITRISQMVGRSH
jgi:N-glycosylase/DNA lyase